MRRQFSILTAMLLCIAFFNPLKGGAQPFGNLSRMPPGAQKFADLALMPPMGWNSWNKFACDGINEKVIREVANEMVSSGMREAGYQYIVIDDCWQVARDSAGNIIADPVKFPGGIKALADYVHSKGLLFGIYTCAGSKTCAGRPASLGYEYQDARQYAAWGVDFLKEDWCNTTTQNAPASYTLMRDALRKAGRPIVFSLCEWGSNKPWLWAKDVGQLWRTTGDISDKWNYTEPGDTAARSGSVLGNLDLEDGLEKYAGPGHWNDPDMLEVGNGGLTEDEERAHFSLWCMLAAPLLAGNDLRNMTPATKAILTNRAVIAIDQDPLGQQGYRVGPGRDHSSVSRGREHRPASKQGLEVFLKPLSGGDTAICLLNRSDQEIKLDFAWKQYGIVGTHAVRDLWKNQDAGTTAAPFRGTVGRHQVIMLRLAHAR
jgi:alpha-galactosidase